MKKYFSIILSILIMILIFKFSSEDIGRSLKHSDKVSGIIELYFGTGEILLSVRKLAHFIIYFFLAFFLQFTFPDNCISPKNKKTSTSNGIYICLF